MKSLNRVFLLCILLAASVAVWAQNGVKKHEVQMGETLYSISRTYGVTVEAIRQVNPNMGSMLLAGSVINIPEATPAQPVATPDADDAAAPQATPTTRPGDGSQCKQLHLVEKKETVYSISRLYGITEDELRAANPQIKKNKVKKGEWVCIPYSAAEMAIIRQQQDLAEQEAEQQRLAEEEARRVKYFNTLNVAIILPFGLDHTYKSNEAVKMVDLYEGFLLAVDDMKRQGANVDVYAYEERGGYNSNIDSILSLPAMQKMNLIVGPFKTENISSVTRFGKKNDIPVVIPCSSLPTITTGVPNVFQVNTNMANLYNQVFRQFINRYPDATVIFVNSADKADKPEFVNGLKDALTARGRTYQAVELGDISRLSELDILGKRTIVIPSSGSQAAFETLIKKLNQNADLSTYDLSLFGYPEWQTFNDKNKQQLHKFKASFFCSFYTNPNDVEVQTFNRRFRQWFKRDQLNAYPLFGLLGYDVGNYFLNGLNTYGTAFLSKQEDIRSASLQNPMLFEQISDDNGFVNTYVRIVSL